MDQFNADQIKHFDAMLGAQGFSTGESARNLHLHDISPHQGVLPAGIAWPGSTEEVARILAYACKENIPITPWGAGTSTEGNPVPARGGWWWI